MGVEEHCKAICSIAVTMAVASVMNIKGKMSKERRILTTS